MSGTPWADGSRELLEHANDHLSRGGDFDRRIAMISIDNAAELMIRTYLSLPRRARGSDGPTRKELDEAQNSFPVLLDLLEKHAADRLEGIALDEVEWFHRIRNELYHTGQGVTVEIAKAEAYMAIVQLLFSNLFGVGLELSSTTNGEDLIGRFLSAWVKVEQTFRQIRAEKPDGEYAYTWNRRYLRTKSNRAAELWHILSNTRNVVVHSPGSLTNGDLREATAQAEELLSILTKNSQT